MRSKTARQAQAGRIILNLKTDDSPEVVVTGLIASVGARLLQGAADRIAGQVFACVKQQLEAPAASVR